MDTFKVTAVQTALEDMFQRQKYYSICTVRDCLKILKIQPPNDAVITLGLFHCQSYANMRPDIRTALVVETLKLFNPEYVFHPQVVLGKHEVESPAPKTFLSRVFG